MTSNTKLLRFKDIKEKFSLSKSAIYSQIRQGTFPQGVKIGKRAVAWGESEVQQIINARINGLNDEELTLLVQQLRKAQNKDE